MKLIVDFRYQCEVEIKKGEINKLKDNLERDRFIPDLSQDINGMFFIDDGRIETGGIEDFDYELRED